MHAIKVCSIKLPFQLAFVLLLPATIYLRKPKVRQVLAEDIRKMLRRN